MFNDSNKNSFTLSFVSSSTDKKTIITQIEYQVDIGSAQKNISAIYLLVADQTAARVEVPNKANIVAVFENPDVRKKHVDIDGVQYPRDGVSLDYALNDCVDQYRDVKMFYKECR